MGYNLNLNGDEINPFRLESTQTRVDTWHDMGHTSNLNLSWDKRGIKEKRAHFPVSSREKGEEKKNRAKSFLSRSTEFGW